MPIDTLIALTEQENLKLLHALFFEHRDELRQAWSVEDPQRSGRITPAIWASVAKAVLGLKFSLASVRSKLLAPSSVDGSGRIFYVAFLNQYSLAQPRCAPLFGVRHYLVALMHKVRPRAWQRREQTSS